MTREEVYKLIDGERLYQEERWNPRTTTSGGAHSFEGWFMYVEDYVNEAKHILTREADPQAQIKVSAIMRKVAALAVAAIEQHGAPQRMN